MIHIYIYIYHWFTFFFNLIFFSMNFLGEYSSDDLFKLFHYQLIYLSFPSTIFLLSQWISFWKSISKTKVDLWPQSWPCNISSSPSSSAWTSDTTFRFFCKSSPKNGGSTQKKLAQIDKCYYAVSLKKQRMISIDFGNSCIQEIRQQLCWYR